MIEKIKIVMILPVLMWIASCGKGVVDVSRETYEPKIVIEAFLVAGHPIEKVFISRNFPVDADLNRMSLIPDVAQTRVTITDVATGAAYPLAFHVAVDNNFSDYYWEDPGRSLIVESGKTYRLDVSAVVENQNLTASAETTVPQTGLEILGVTPDRLQYMERGDDGDVQNFVMDVQRAPGCSFYYITTRAMNPSVANFNFNNAFDTPDTSDVVEDLEDWTHEFEWVQNRPLEPGVSFMDMMWYNFWFFGRHEIVVFACDPNYTQFVQTYNDVQEMDGNFHEPRFCIDGDGIGVFGSMTTDTCYVDVLRN